MTTLVSSSAYRGYLGTGTPDATSWFRGDGSWQSNITAVDLSVTGNTTLGNAAGDSVTVNGASWTWSGTATRLMGDFSTTTIGNRPMVQSNVTNGNTNFGVLPNGTSNIARLVLLGSSNTVDTALFIIGTTSSSVTLNSSAAGTGTVLPFTLQSGGIDGLRIDTSRNIVVGIGQLADSATDGFLYIPGTTSGAPSGAPTSYTGRHPMVVDDTNNRLYINIGGTWRYATLT